MTEEARTPEDEFEPIALGSVSTETKGIGDKSEELFAQESPLPVRSIHHHSHLAECSGFPVNPTHRSHRLSNRSSPAR